MRSVYWIFGGMGVLETKSTQLSRYRDGGIDGDSWFGEVQRAEPRYMNVLPPF
jgi:hypothetical protein